MDLNQLLTVCIIGLIAGGLATLVVKDSKYGCLGKMVVGILGAFIGGWIFDALDIYVDNDFLGTVLTSTLGAVVLLLLIRVAQKN